MGIKDDISGLYGKGFSSTVDLQEILDKNGKLKSYRRETLKDGDGRHSASISVADTKTVKQKMVYITMKIKNTGKEEKINKRVQAPHLFEKNKRRKLAYP